MSGLGSLIELAQMSQALDIGRSQSELTKVIAKGLAAGQEATNLKQELSLLESIRAQHSDYLKTVPTGTKPQDIVAWWKEQKELLKALRS